MKTIYILMCILVTVSFSEITHAQNKIGYTYDTNGNRDSRAVVIRLKSATIPRDSLQEKQAKKPLDDMIGLQQTRIYPNPTKGKLQIDFPALDDKQPIIWVYDPSGKLIVKKTAISSGNEVDLSPYPSGLYIMRIQIGQEKKEWKIIKE
jgi:hypothetical protein